MNKLFASLQAAIFKPIDDRAYALVRIVFGSVLLIHIFALWPYRLTLFSPAGMLPADVDGNGRYISLFALFKSDTGLDICFAFAALSALFLTLGVLPRLAALACMIWLASVTNHLAFVGYGADFVMRVFGFLILISPLGACWALTGSRSPGGPRAQVPQYGILLMRLQFAIIYFDTAVAKCFSEPWRSGEAFSKFMLSVYSHWKLPLFLDWVWLSKIATYGSLLFEFALPILLFIPRTRLLAIFTGLVFHVMITIAVPSLILFSLAMLVGYAAFLDGERVDQLAKLFRRGERPQPTEAS